MPRSGRLCIAILLACSTLTEAQVGGVIDAHMVLKWPRLNRTRQHQHKRALSQSSRFSKPYRICTTPWSPIVSCEAGADTSTFSGYQIELFRKIAQDLGWEAEDWYFDCIDWSPMMDDLRADDGTCFMTASGEHGRVLRFMLSVNRVALHVSHLLFHPVLPCKQLRAIFLAADALQLPKTTQLHVPILVSSLHFMICHSKNCHRPHISSRFREQRWNRIRVVIGMQP